MQSGDTNHHSVPTLRPWFIWGLVVIFYFYENILQVSPGVMTTELMSSLHITGLELGNLAAFYFYAYAPTQIPVGMLLDRFGPRKLVTIATLIVVIGSFIFAKAEGLLHAQIGRLLIGFGSAYAAVSCMKLASTWFPLERFGLLTGLMVTVGFSGSIFGEKPMALLVNGYGWRSSMMVFVYSGVFLAVLIWLIVRDHPDNLTAPTDINSSSSPTRELLHGLGYILKNSQTWIVAIYGGLMFAPTSIFGALWGVPFLSIAHHLTKADAAGVNLFLFFGWIIGGPIAGLISDKLKRRKTTLWFGSAGALVTMLIIIYCDSVSILALKITLFLFGFFSSGFLPSFSIIREISPSTVSATALGFMNMFNMVGGALGQPLVGYLLDRGWGGTMSFGARIYTIGNYHSALTILPIMIGISLLILPLLKETYCQSVEDQQWHARTDSLQ